MSVRQSQFHGLRGFVLRNAHGFAINGNDGAALIQQDTENREQGRVPFRPFAAEILAGRDFVSVCAHTEGAAEGIAAVGTDLAVGRKTQHREHRDEHGADQQHID